MNQPPYNPNYPVSPYPPQAGNVGFEQHQQGAQPPPYSSGPAAYSSGPDPYPQQQYTGPPGGPGPYGPGAYPPGAQGPHGTATHHPGGQPQTVYVYEDRQRRQKNSDEDTCFAMMAGACAMCLCCSLLAD